MEAEIRFPTMGSDVHVVIVGGSLVLLEEARDLLDDLERRWSRFRPDEISLMNAMAGCPVRVSPPTTALVERALEGVELTSLARRRAVVATTCLVILLKAQRITKSSSAGRWGLPRPARPPMPRRQGPPQMPGVSDPAHRVLPECQRTMPAWTQA